MGVLDKLMFWKSKTVEHEYEVDGCFTLGMDGKEVQAVPGLETIADITSPEDPATEQC